MTTETQLPTTYQSIIHLSRYSRYLEEKQRRETWAETVQRMTTYLAKKIKDQKGIKRLNMPELDVAELEYMLNKLEEIEKSVMSQDVVGSMRLLMSAGEACERDNVAAYNCAYTEVTGSGEKLEVLTDEMRKEGFDEPISISISNPIDFDEIMYILLCGTGIGFSCERQVICTLPVVGHKLTRGIYAPTEENFKGVPFSEISFFSKSDNCVMVADSKYGWASALRILIVELYNGNFDITWNLGKIRPAGTPLKVFGGRASGPEPLHTLFKYCVDLFKSCVGRKLVSIEVHGLVCKIAQVVVVGGVRRCYVGDTQIKTPTNTLTIKDISIGDTISTGGQEAKVSAKVDSGVQKVISLVHQFGKTTLTPNHRIAVFTDINTIEYVEAGSLQPGNRLAFDISATRGLDKVTLPELVNSTHWNSIPLNIPTYLDEDLAWLIGLVHGDGHISAKGIEISGNIDETSTLQKAANIFKDKFGRLPKVTKDGHKGKGIRIRINSVALSKWFLKHIKQSNTSIEIPGFIMESNIDCRYAYLAGLLDADGRIRDDGVFDICTTIYKNYADQLQVLISSLGLASNIMFTSAHKRRQEGINAKDHYAVKVKGNTSRKVAVYGLSSYSLKIQNFSSSYSSPVDFLYPTEWCDDHKGSANNMTYGWAQQKGLVDSSLLYAPVELLDIQDAGEQQTWDIEVEAIHCFTADNLLTHNSALLSLSNLSDERMRKAKSGQWWHDHPEFALANNSIAYTERPEIETFFREMTALIESKSGERGIYNSKAAAVQASKWGRRSGEIAYGTNPCSEIILRSKQFCNLTEVIAKENDNIHSLMYKVELATILGTIQSMLVDFKYLSPIWERNTKEERLLGVSITGIMDNAILNNSSSDDLPQLLESLRDMARETNHKWADMLGIPRSRAITAVKPSGTVSQLVNSASGIHARHSPFYIRRIRMDKKDPMYSFLSTQGVHVEDDVTSPTTTAVFSFPMKSPESAVCRMDRTALEQLDLWLIYQRYWCEHKPSITVSVKDEEWPEVSAWVWKHFDEISGISFLPFSDHTYRQAPYEDITEDQYNDLISKASNDIDFSQMVEIRDNTEGSQTMACVAGACEV